MFERILVPLDGSPSGEACLPFLGKLSRWQAPHAVLVQVLDPRLLDARPAGDVDAGSLARTYLDQVGTMLRTENIPSTRITRVGPTAETLLAAAREEHVSLLAISTHGRLTPPALPYGTVAAELFRSCPVPILAAPSGGPEAISSADGRPFRSILILVNGDLRHPADLTVPAEVAVQTGAEAVLLRLAPPAETGRGEAEERADAEEYVERLGVLFNRRRISTNLVVEQGDPVKAIQEFALRRHADLLVLGREMASGDADERSPFDSLLRKTGIPVLLLGPEKPESVTRREERVATKGRP